MPRPTAAPVLPVSPASVGSPAVAPPSSAPSAHPGAGGHRFLVVALLATLLLWNVPYGEYALYPFKIFATWLHESSHGLLMALTGAGLGRLEIYRDTSGLAYPEHGVSAAAQAAISSAGYMGTAFFGGVFLVLGRTERGARRVLALLGALLAFSVAVAVRNLFGAAALLVGGAGLVALARWGTDRACAFVLNFLAAQSCINAVLDIRVLFGATMYVDGRPHRQSDADAVAAVLGGPAWLWASLWLLWSFGVFYAALRWVRVRGAAGAR